MVELQVEWDLKCFQLNKVMKIYNQATSKQMIAQDDSRSPLFAHACTTYPIADALGGQDAYELTLVAQYLDLNQDSTIANKPVGPCLPLTETVTLSPVQVQNQNKRASAFHNFQKHLINTLKQHIKIKKMIRSEGSKHKLAFELWEYFTSSSKATKKFLFSILGDNLFLNVQIKNDPNRYGDELWEEILKQGEEQLQAAQKYLRGAVVKQAQGLLRGKLLRGRRIQRPEEFHKYFSQFVSELEDGVVTRRMPKLKKLQLLGKQVEPIIFE